MAAAELTLLTVREVQVFTIPVRTTARGYRASDWDPSAHIWSGRLKVTAVGEKCTIKLEDPNSGELFAQCKYDDSGSAVEPVVDSSRYFVLRIEDASTGRHAFVGVGFLDRNEAFDFNVALQDHIKASRRLREAGSTATASVQSTPQPAIDYSLKGAISINIGGKQQNSEGRAPAKETSAANIASFALPPPPSSSRSTATAAPPASVNTGSTTTAQPPSNWVTF